MATISFGFAGCAGLDFGHKSSGDCGSSSLGKCGGCSSCGFSNLFRHKSRTVNTYEGAVPEGMPVQGVPMDGMSPGMGSPLPSNDDPQLSPAPGANSTGSVKKSSASGLGSNASMGKAYYQAEVSGVRGGSKEARRDRGFNSSAPTSLAGGIAAPGPDDPLAILPEPTNPSEAAADSSPPKAPTAGEPPRLQPTPSGLSAELPPKPVEAPASLSMAPGIRRFKVLEPNLSAGSLPKDGGWAWLVEKGYKTVLDLREPGEIKQEELAAIDHHGLRYVSLSCSPSKIDPARLKRFATEIALESTRPMFVFDTDGSRPAVMYFVHEVANAKKEAKLAERDVEDLGASESPLWKLAGEFVARVSAPAVLTTPSASISPPAPAPDAPVEPFRAPFLDGVAQMPPAPKSEPSSSSSKSASWSPLATLVLTSLGLPIAYFGRSALSWGGRALASLPAPAKSQKSLASASDE